MAVQPQAVHPQVKPRVTPPPHAPPTPQQIIEQLQDIVAAQSGVIRAQSMYIASLIELLELEEPPGPPGPPGP